MFFFISCYLYVHHIFVILTSGPCNNFINDLIYVLIYIFNILIVCFKRVYNASLLPKLHLDFSGLEGPSPVSGRRRTTTRKYVIMVSNVSDIDILVGAEVKSKLESDTNVDAAIQNVVDVAEGEREFIAPVFPTLYFVLKSAPLRTCC